MKGRTFFFSDEPRCSSTVSYVGMSDLLGERDGPMIN